MITITTNMLIQIKFSSSFLSNVSCLIVVDEENVLWVCGQLGFPIVIDKVKE